MDFKEEAEELLKAENYEALLKLSEEEIKNNPDSIEGYTYKMLSVPDEKEKIACFKKLHELEIDAGIEPESFYNECFNATSIYNKRKSLKDVLDYIEKIVQKYPNSDKVYIMKAKALKDIIFDSPLDQIKANKMILEACNKALELNPNNLEAYDVLGDLSLKNKKYDEAKKYYEKIIEICINLYGSDFKIGFDDEKRFDNENGNCVDKIETEIKIQDAHSKIASCIAQIEGFESGIKYCNDLIEEASNNINSQKIKFDFLTKYEYKKLDEFEKEALKKDVSDIFKNLLEEYPDSGAYYYADMMEFYKAIKDNKSANLIYKEGMEKYKDGESQRMLGLEKAVEDSNRQSTIFIFTIIAIYIIINILTGEAKESIEAIRKLFGF